MKTYPLISVYMPCHNRGHVISRAIDSVLNQSYKNVELIVVDDGSMDDTQKILHKYQDQYDNFSCYIIDKSRGACYARNLAIANAKGDLIAGIDDDDEWHPERLTVLLSTYDPQYSFVFAEDNLLRSDGKVVRLRKKRIVTLYDMCFQNEIGNQILTETTRLKEIGGFDEQLVAAQDYDAWIRLIKNYGNAKCVNLPLQTMHVDAKNRITHSPKKVSGYLFFLKKHKSDMNETQLKFHYLVIYYMKNKKPSIYTAIKLIDWAKLKRRLRILVELFFNNNHNKY